MGCVFKLVRVAFVAFILVALAGAGLGTVLALSGSPEPCVDRGVDPAPSNDQALSENWQQLLFSLASGEDTQITVSEDEASTVGANYIEQRNIPVEDFRLYFCPDGRPQAAGKVEFLGIQSNVVAKGDLDLSGAQPRLQIDSVKAGRLPGFVSKPLAELVLDEQDVTNVPLPQQVSDVDYQDGQAIVTVSLN